ncbi:MAG TPA: DUF4412 domain-containing protein [Rhodopila sp.]|nr:DUF4412 domain-containing protein [Rhodopila sp.]
MLKYAMLAGVFAVAAYPVRGSAQPVVQPTRDVSVQYHVTGDSMAGPGQGHVDSIKISYGSGGQRMRIEPVGQPAFMIVDRSAGHMTVVMSGQNMYMDLPYDPHKVMDFSPANAKFTQRGTATVAGLTCTEYDVQSQQHNGTVCLTSDGVMLRAVSKDPQHQGSLEATNVAYGPQPDSVFQPPPGFQKMDMAHMGQRGRPPR